MEKKELQFTASASSGLVSGILLLPDDPQWLLVYAHGAGAPMRHPFMESTAYIMADRGIATFRYNFPYMENRKGRPDPAPIAQATVRSAVAKAHELVPDIKILAGGKSFGGRMTSQAAAQEPLPNVAGLVFFGFPLHAPGRPSSDRAEHLKNVGIPVLFLQGTRDSLASLELIKPVCAGLSQAHLHIVEGGDHSFKVPKALGKTEQEVRAGLAEALLDWTGRI